MKLQCLQPSQSIYPLRLVGVIGVQSFVRNQRSAFCNHPTSPNTVSSKSWVFFFFFLLEPKVHGQSSPMCLHPPRSRSLIFQHYKLWASSHFSEQKCKEMFDMRNPCNSLASPLIPGYLFQVGRSFFPQRVRRRQAALHSLRYLLSRLSCESMTNPSVRSLQFAPL